MNSNTRQMSVAAYIKQRKERNAENQHSAGTMRQFLINSDALHLTLPAPDLESSITFTIDETVSLQVDRGNTSKDGPEFDSTLRNTVFNRVII